MGSAFIASALGTWLGIQAVRMTLAMIIWNVAEDNTTYAGEVAALVWVAGIGGSFLTGLLPVKRPSLWLAGLFAILIVLRQAIPGESSSPALAFASWVVWLWWLPAFIGEASGRLASIAAGVVLGVALEVAGQIALHGLDLELVQGPASVIAALLLAAAFTFAVGNVRRGPERSTGAWGAFALGPFLFVELTFLANLGRLEVITGVTPLVYGGASALGFFIALAVVALDLPRTVRVALMALAVLALIPGQSLGTATLVTLILAQTGLALGLVTAFEAPPRRARQRVHAFTALGAFVFFVFAFVFYTYRDRTDLLWPLAALLVVAPGILSTAVQRVTSFRPAIAAGAVILGAMAVAAIPPSNARSATNVHSGGDLVVLQYNVHQGLDYWSVPSAPALVDRIESANADLVALQEVNRGWDLSAGIDFFSYLRWRLPQYHVVYGRMDTGLFGNAILSRYPITNSGYGILPHINSALTRGYVWADIAAPSGPLLFVSTHFTAYAGYDEERLQQADAYATFWAKRPRSILAGDYNSHPEDVDIKRLEDAGLVDAGAAAGIGNEYTYSSGDPHERIDYVFVSPDIKPVSAEILPGTASDHRPVRVVLRAP